MNDYNFDNQLKIISEYVYSNSLTYLPKRWEKIAIDKNEQTGFYGEAFIDKKEKNIVIAFRGTDLNKGINEAKKDLINDNYLLLKNIPPQINNAREFKNKIQKNFKGYNIILTGHSLGGSLAQIIGAESGEKTVTYGAYGTKQLINSRNNNFYNIKNYGNANDIIFVSNIDNQLGETYVIDNSINNGEELYKTNKINKNIGLSEHFLNNIGDLSKANKYTGLKPNVSVDNLVLKGAVSKTLDEINKPLYTREMIGKMTADEYLLHEPMIMEQLKTQGGIPSEKQLNQQNNISGFINQISGNSNIFTREDIKNMSSDEYGNSNIFTREDIKNMSSDEYLKNEKAIDFQLKTIGIPSQAQANEAVQNGGMIYIQPYTRSDGTEVKGYYRSVR